MLVRLITATRPRNPQVAALDRSAYLILHALSANSTLTSSLLAEQLELDLSTVSRQVAAMEAKGLIQRVPDSPDSRSVQLVMTTLGRHQWESMRTARRDTYSQILKDWSPGEIGDLARTLRRLNQDIKAYQHQAR